MAHQFDAKKEEEEKKKVGNLVPQQLKKSITSLPYILVLDFIGRLLYSFRKVKRLVKLLAKSEQDST